MSLLGKGFFIWKIPYCDGGDPARIAARARGANLSHVLIKIADGAYWDYNVDKERGIDLIPPVKSALEAAGVEVWGWHYVRGDQPLAEAQQAIKRIKQLGVAGYVIDAEIEYRDRSKERAAGVFMDELRKHLPELPMALSTYRYPRTHPALPYEVFLEHVDYAMPQVYFESAHNPVEQLDRSIGQWMEFKNARPIIPTGPAYRRGSWRPSANDITRFLTHAKELGVPASNFWSWYFASRDPDGDMFQAVKEFDWPFEPPIADMPERLVGRLNQHEPDHVAALYRENAAHVTGQRTVLGRQHVQTWYRTLLNDLLPQATFEVTGKIVNGNTRQFTWKADSPNGKVRDGNDTLNTVDGRIRYHYSYFTIQRPS